jgi:hypothetical protein
MSEHQLSLPDDVYRGLLADAAKKGISPVDWIAAHLPASDEQQEFSPDVVADLIGSFDSRQHSYPPREKTPFEEILIEKMAKQGVHIP